jgi:hypothetical protein
LYFLESFEPTDSIDEGGFVACKCNSSGLRGFAVHIGLNGAAAPRV